MWGGRVGLCRMDYCLSQFPIFFSSDFPLPKKVFPPSVSLCFSVRDITTLGRNNEGSTTDEDDTSSHDEEKTKENWTSPDKDEGKDMFVYSKDVSDDSSTSEV